MYGVITFLNTTGKSFVGFSTSMLIQSSVLIIVLLVLDAFLRKKVRVVVLYGIWMLVLVKLVLPTTLSSPTGLGYWLGDKVPSIITDKASSILKQNASILQRTKPVSATIPYGLKITDLSSFGTSPEPIAGTSANFTATASPARASLSWQGFAFMVWLAVVIAMVLLVIRRMFFVKGLLAKSKNPNDSMVDIFEGCRKKMGIKRSIFLELSPVAMSPSVCGIFRPKILIPQNLPHRLKADDMRSVLLHELAHIKRGDVWVSFIQTILQIAYFYNPLLWVANVIIRKVREQAVDEMVLVAMGEQAEDYPETLLNVSRMTFGRPALNLRLIGIVESKKALERRIMIMLSRPVPKSSKLGICRLIAIVVIGAVILPMGYNPTEQTALAASFNDGRIADKIIVPGVRVGEYTFGMSKDDVLRKLGEPEAIFYGQQRYTLDNLPRSYFMSFSDISFHINDDAVIGIGVHSPLYKFTNGLGVNDSEQKIKQVFGYDFNLKEGWGKDFLNYKDKGLHFEIHKKDRTVMEIGVSPIESSKSYKRADIVGKTIVPGLRVGDYTVGMRKDEVLRKLGEPKAIQLSEDEDDVVHRGQEGYDLKNLPSNCILFFDKIFFLIEKGSVEAISVHSPLYKLRNGLSVGDSERKIKRDFGEHTNIEEALGKEYLCYKSRGIAFQINKINQTIAEIVVYKPEGYRDDPDAPDRKGDFERTIIPGVRVGEYTLGMGKDEVLRKMGEPKAIQLEEDGEVIQRGEEKYDLNNRECLMIYSDISFGIEEDSVEVIMVRSPLYKLSNGLIVGDSEHKVKQAFGKEFKLEEALGKVFRCYHSRGLAFEIHKNTQTIAQIVIYGPKGNSGDSDAPDRQEHSKHTIVPGLRVGEYTLGMSKDEVMKKLGEPGHIHLGGEQYTLNNLPRRYIMSFGDISFTIDNDKVTGIGVRSPLYKFANGLGVGNSEEEIKRAFGNDFQLGEYGWKNQLNYEDKGIQFEIRNENKMVIEIDVYQTEHKQRSDRRSSQELSNLVRQAAEDGRISFKLTTPDEFKAIAGRPTREWTESDDELIYLKYPGIQATFFGKPEADIPHMLVNVSCEGRGIDIGRNRPIVLRNEGDLDKFGTFWGYSGVDLSRLDLSQKGELLKKMPFDSRTVWPEPDRLPHDFDPKAVMEWGKYPGLGIKKLHDQDVTGKGVHVAIIDQPLLLGHIEYRDQLVSYKEIETGNVDPQMHGPPVASILVGKTCGVAPEAVLHYWAEPSWKGDYKYRCIALEQIIQFNKGKEKSEQIRVVSISKGFSPSEANLDRWKALLEKAKKSGIYVVHCSSMGFGAGCRFMKDSDNPANYRLCSFYGGDVYRQSGTFFTPIDHRTTASAKARDAYTFWTRSGLSWGAPYYAGVVALGIQVNPDLRPDQIDKLLYDSGWDFQKGRLINPVGFVKAARAVD